MGYKMYQGYKVSTHSRLKAAGYVQTKLSTYKTFQHTAA